MTKLEAYEIISSWYGEDKESDEAIKIALESLENDINLDNLDVLNNIEVTEWDCNGTDLVYVLIDNNKSNKTKLKQLGANDDDILKMAECYDDSLDIKDFAFEKLGATCYQHGKGFLVN